VTKPVKVISTVCGTGVRPVAMRDASATKKSSNSWPPWWALGRWGGALAGRYSAVIGATGPRR